MKPFHALLFVLAFIALSISPASAQGVKDYTIRLNARTITPQANLNQQVIDEVNRSVSKEAFTVILQFNGIPGEKQKHDLQIDGIHLLNYVGGGAYIVSIHKSLSATALRSANVRSISSLSGNDKVNSFLQNVTADTTVHASIFSFSTPEEAIDRLQQLGFSSTKVYSNYPILKIHVPAGRLNELAHLNFIEYIEPPPPPLTKLNYKSNAGTRANVLHLANYNLNGEGIVFQVNELTGYPQDHLDFKDRSIGNKVILPAAYHSTHVHGIIAGAGLISELYKGYAPKATFNTSSDIADPPTDMLTYGADISNNSYASGGLCPASKTVPTIALPSLIVDRQALQYRSLIHVMSAGNSGGYQCPLYPLGYNTVYSGYQSAKSTLSVGATYTNGQLAEFSSKGPGREGRFKPEIVAPGASIISTVPNNGYGYNSGTSMSGPAVVGGLGLLYQRYVQLQGTKPDNSLMKPLICNTATDMGPAGPDYGYGFGFMNLNRAIEVLDAGNFYKDSVANQQTKAKTIHVPQGIAKLKMMLYWQDPPASPIAARPLVNDLDIKVTAPDGTEFLPFVLDTLPSLVRNLARRGEDHINNIEQVVIDNPPVGNYTINVKGYEVGEGGSQNFYVVYDLVPDAVQLTFPGNGEVVAPNDNITVLWDSWGDTTSTYKIEFSADNGNQWQTLSSNVVGTSFDWTVPPLSTIEARLRVTRNKDGKTSSPGSFQIIGVPYIQPSSSQCPGSISLQWAKVNGATDYEVMWYRDGDMRTVSVSTDTSYIFRNLSEDSVYYVTVRTRINGLPGRRAYAMAVQPNTGDCKNPINDHDLKPQNLVYPLVGRAFTSKRLGVESLTMRIKNLDDSMSSSGFTVSYSVNGKPWVREICGSSIGANGFLDYTFHTPFDFSLAGDYQVRLAVASTTDSNHNNDTTACTVRHFRNAPVPVVTGVTDTTTLSATTTYNSNRTGLNQLDRFDYENQAPSDHMRVGAGIVFEYTATADPAKRQSLTATYNLSNFDTTQNSIELQFNYYRFTMPANSFDSLLIRGNDTAPWILVQDLLPPDSPRAVNKQFRIPITGYLKENGQDFSSSFQVKWVPTAYNAVVLMGNISLLNRTNDLALASIDSLLPYSCNLSKSTPINVTIQNNNKTAVSNVPVKYRINNGNIISEVLPLIPPQASLTYKFTQTADLSVPGDYKIEAWTEQPQDVYPDNDTSRVSVQNEIVVNTFPYLEDFEKGNGGWLSGGTRSSWEHGTPSSALINGAASGNKAWKTNLDGNYNPLEGSAIYTGCFDFSKLSKPVISMSIAMNMDSCPPFYCDYMMVQYCANGKDWLTLNNRVTSVQNWQTYFTARQYYRWHVVTARIVDTSFKLVRFRLYMRSDSYNNFEGVGIDDFHVYDSSNAIYSGNSVDLHQFVNGGQQWIAFTKDSKLVAAVQPNNQQMGDVQIQTFSNSGSVRNFHGQYYLDRNFVFKPSKPLQDSVMIRLYFTDKESDSLLFANSCNSCISPPNAYRLGVSYYQSSDTTELDNSIVNNRKGEWHFVSNDKIRIVPFMTGYYVEFKAKDPGEFRLSNGGLDGNSDLPVQIQQFSANQNLLNAVLKWNTAQEINIDYFNIEVARGNTAFKNEQFLKIGEVKSTGRSASIQSYSFTDTEPGKNGVRYYRLKAIDALGNYSISNSIPLMFSEELEWQVFPNPGNGKFNLVYQSRGGDEIQVTIFNSVGALMKEATFIANGYVETKEIDLSKGAFANGIYFLQIKSNKTFRVLRLVKQ